MKKLESFSLFRLQYLIVHVAIMLADGLQGTHLYVLYEGYGYSVASLYCLGFVSGALTSPLTGPLVDKIGRRNSAVIYCLLEICINCLELYDGLMGLILSRTIGGITTNLLFTVFESWLVTEHRKKGFEENKLEIIMRDSVIASNLSAIASGCLAHVLANYYGNVGPFKGAVFCTSMALVPLVTCWGENYGNDDGDKGGEMSIKSYMRDAFSTITSDSKIVRLGISQGLSEGALQTFIFLWSPSLRHFASSVKDQQTAIGIVNGEPAFGLIFGAFMACGVVGGFFEPFTRKLLSRCISSLKHKDQLSEKQSEQVVCHVDDDIDTPLAFFKQAKQLSEEQSEHVLCHVDGNIDAPLTFLKQAKLRSTQSAVTISTVSMADDSDSDESSSSTTVSTEAINEVLTDFPCPNTSILCDKELKEEKSAEQEDSADGAETLTALCYFLCAILLAVPVVIPKGTEKGFYISLAAFLTYEILVGIYLPCEGVLRTKYIPNSSICSVMNMLRIIVNIAVALGVISTNFISMPSAFSACAFSLFVAGMLQASIDNEEVFYNFLSRCLWVPASRVNDAENKNISQEEEVPQQSTVEKVSSKEPLGLRRRNK